MTHRPRPFLLILISLLVCATSCRPSLNSGDRAGSGRTVHRIGVAPFTNLTGDHSVDWTAKLFAAATVRQLGGFSDTSAFLAASPSDAVAQGATHILHGTLAYSRSQYQLELSIEDAKTHQFSSFERLASPAPAWLEWVSSAPAKLQSALHLPGRLLPLDVKDAISLRAIGMAMLDPLTERSQRLDEAVRREATCGWCWVLLADLTAQTAGPDAARDLLLREKPVDAQLPEATRAQLGWLRAQLDRDGNGRRPALERLVELIPAELDATTALAQDLSLHREFARSETLYRRVWRVEPDRAGISNELAYLCAWQGKFDEAMKWVDRYAEAAPGSANPDDSRGEILFLQGKWYDAQKAFSASYDRDPAFNNGAAMEKAALSLWFAGDLRRAGQLLERYFQDLHKRGDPLIVWRRARWQYLYGQTANARAVMETLMTSRDPEQGALAAASLALWTIADGEPQTAARFASMMEQLPAPRALDSVRPMIRYLVSEPGGEAPNGTPEKASTLRALSYTLRGRFAEAVPEWRKAVQESTSGSDALPKSMLAWSLTGSGQGKARDADAAWPLLTPDDALFFDFLVYPNVLVTRARLAEEQNKSEEARQYYELFLKASGDRRDPFGQVRLARAAVRL